VAVAPVEVAVALSFYPHDNIDHSLFLVCMCVCVCVCVFSGHKSETLRHSFSLFLVLFSLFLLLVEVVALAGATERAAESLANERHHAGFHNARIPPVSHHCHFEKHTHTHTHTPTHTHAHSRTHTHTHGTTSLVCACLSDDVTNC
jgi:ABC-type nickel/cobalt efflux system permease component RcnA